MFPDFTAGAFVWRYQRKPCSRISFPLYSGHILSRFDNLSRNKGGYATAHLPSLIVPYITDLNEEGWKELPSYLDPLLCVPDIAFLPLED